MIEDQLRTIHGDKTDYAIAKKMAEISLEEDKNNYGEKNHKEALIKKINSYKSNLCDYKSGRRRPRPEMLLLMSKALGCKREELEAIFYPPDNVSVFGDDSQAVVVNGKKAPVKNEEVTELTEENAAFKVLEVSSKHIYFENSALGWSKSFKMQCQQDEQNLLDFYEYVTKAVKDSLNSAKFHQCFKEGEQVQVDLTISCCSKMPE